MTQKHFLAPVLLGFMLAAVAPIVALFTLSGFEWNLLGSPNWVGLDNFVNLNLGPSLAATLWIGFFAVILIVSLGCLLGYFGYSAVYLLPWFTAPIALGVIWKWLLAPTGGLISSAFGFRLDLLSDPFWAPITVAAVIAWSGIGYTAMIFSAGFRSLPKHTIDAASLDGAGRLATLISIQLPQLRKLIFFIVATATIQALTSYDLIYVLTGGGPSAATDVASLHIVSLAMKTFEVGLASAMSLVFTAFVIAILLFEYAVYKIICRKFND